MLDCLTMWLGDRFDFDDDVILDQWRGTLSYLAAAPFPSIVVGNEIGWAPVPVEPALRRFRDLAGFLGQSTAEVAAEAWLLVAGCPIRLK